MLGPQERSPPCRDPGLGSYPPAPAAPGSPPAPACAAGLGALGWAAPTLLPVASGTALSAAILALSVPVPPSLPAASPLPAPGAPSPGQARPCGAAARSSRWGGGVCGV